jgi:ABC-type nitrate/sulfonate/bicarbonate transport system ATPase subunit
MASVSRELRRGGPPDIALRDVWMSYPGRGPGASVHVLERIDVTIGPGELVCIVGPSGCGKTTLLNVVAGFLAPTRGAVLIGGEPVRGPDPGRILIFQEGGIFPWLTVRDNIGLGLLGISRAERTEVVDRYLHLVGLTGFEKAYPSELSGGMRQRVEIARALAVDAEVLYMDEPFGALDYIARAKIRDDLLRIWMQEPKTILFVTHDIDEAVQLADTIVVMSHKPSIVRAALRIDLARPREVGSHGYLLARDRIVNAMGEDPVSLHEVF